MKRFSIGLVVLLSVVFLPSLLVYARCGVESLFPQRCEGSSSSQVMVRCYDGTSRNYWAPRPCPSSWDSESAESFCEYRCERPIIRCPEPNLDKLIGVICRNVHRCRPDISVSDCQRDIENVSASDELGLSEGAGETTFSVIREALADGRIRWDEAVYCDCWLRLRKFPECGGINEFEPFGEGLVEEIIPEQCGNDQYPGTLLPDDFNPVTTEVCTSAERENARELIQRLDTNPLSTRATNALAAGCAASTTDLETFMAAFLEDLELDPACAADTSIQNDMGNWEGPDTSDLSGTCDDFNPVTGRVE
ncbi:MAG: hypothetical protein HY466_03825 [Deltaproteobacteria bacterium]|nr:hypothetical protein [Deltaproteobacteria bacterium]